MEYAYYIMVTLGYKHTYTVCVIIIDFPLHQWFTNAPQCYVISALPVVYILWTIEALELLLGEIHVSVYHSQRTKFFFARMLMNGTLHTAQCPARGVGDSSERYILRRPTIATRWPASSWIHYNTSCNTSAVFLKMGKIISLNMLSWLELLINRYCYI